MPVFVGAGTSSFMKGDGGVGVSTATTTTRNALSNVRPGTLIFNQTTNLLEYYNGTSWTAIDTPPNISSVNNTNILETQIAAGFALTLNASAFVKAKPELFVTLTSYGSLEFDTEPCTLAVICVVELTATDGEL